MNIGQLTKSSRILIEQDSGPTLLTFKRKMLGLPFDEQILSNDERYMQYSRNKKRIIIKDDKFCRQYFNDLGEVSNSQVFLPGQLRKVLLQSLHGTAGKHPGISKMLPEVRQKYYFPSIQTYVTNWVCDCKICIKDKRINNTRITQIYSTSRNGISNQKISCKSTYCQNYHEVGLRKYHYNK